ncbi:hypothetical protein UT300009_29970 [Paraclostridium bifermentans]
MKKKLVFWIDEKRVEADLTFEEMLNYDNKYCERVIRTFAKKCYEKVKNMHDNIMTKEDFYAEGLARAFYCYEMYNADKSFVPYLQTGLDQWWCDYTKSIFANKRRNTSNVVYEYSAQLEEEGLLNCDNCCGDDEHSIGLFEISEDLEDALEKLNDEEKKIMEFLINQETTKKIFADELGITRPTLDTRIQNVRDKMYSLMPEYMGIY